MSAARKYRRAKPVELFREMLAAPEYRSGRLSFVVPPTLARMQLERLLDGREARCFEDPAEAETWLFANRREPTRAALETGYSPSLSSFL